MSTGLEQKRFSYRFFTDKWMFIVVLWFYFVISYKLLPHTITDVYLPFILCFIKFAWTKSSYIMFNDDSFTYCHKELPTYLKKQIKAKNIIRVYLKVLFFTTIDKQYCLVEYVGEEAKARSLLLNLERFTHPEMVKLSIVSFCKKNGIEILY